MNKRDSKVWHTCSKLIKFPKKFRRYPKAYKKEVLEAFFHELTEIVSSTPLDT